MSNGHKHRYRRHTTNSYIDARVHCANPKEWMMKGEKDFTCVWVFVCVCIDSTSVVKMWCKRNWYRCALCAPNLDAYVSLFDINIFISNGFDAIHLIIYSCSRTHTPDSIAMIGNDGNDDTNACKYPFNYCAFFLCRMICCFGFNSLQMHQTLEIFSRHFEWECVCMRSFHSMHESTLN